MDNLCIICGHKFVAKYKWTRYCSSSCRMKVSRDKNKSKRIYNRICIVCNKEFVANHHNIKICSHRCKLEKRKEIHQKYNNNYKIKNGASYAVKSRINRPLCKLKKKIHGYIYKRLKYFGYEKDTNTENILGCSIPELKVHIEAQWQAGMNWENHSYLGWHIDHKICLASAKTKEDMYKLWHYTNLQPLWAQDNLKKSSKIGIEKCLTK